MKHVKYFIYICKHKWFVFLAGLRVGGIPLWRLIIHDYSKFSKAEWGPYVNRFFSGNAGVEDKELDPLEFKEAWRHHWQNNPHHWEYWVNNHFGDNGEPEVMPVKFAREMVADWLGAGRAITGSWDLTGWYNKTKDKQKLHPLTRKYVEDLLDKMNYGK